MGIYVALNQTVIADILTGIFDVINLTFYWSDSI
jgi:hypothetical protein